MHPELLIHFVKLFRELQARNLDPLVTRFLLAMYSSQMLCVKWRNHLTGFFGTTNGVRQGGVLSPTLFTVYIDGLFKRLARSGLGCYMGSLFLGALGFADDVTLLAPSLRAAQHMVSICEEYANEFHIIFNGSKSKLMVFRHAEDNSQGLSIHIGSHVILESSAELHLGHKISTDNVSATLVKEAKGNFWSSFNSLMSSHGSISPDLLCRLCIAYCSSFYGSPLWTFKDAEQVAIAWRSALRRVWNLPFATHKLLYPLISGCLPLHISFHKRFTKFAKAGLFGPSRLTATVMRVACCNPSSVFSRNLNIISQLYSIDSERIRVTDIDGFFIRWWHDQSVSRLDGALVLRELMQIRADGGTIWCEEDVEEMALILATQ